MDVVIVVVQIIACIAVTDFLFGVFHWLEDGYGDPSWWFIGPAAIQPNILHHFDSSHMTHHGWVYNARAPIAAAAIAIVSAIALDAMTWQLALIIAIGINGNQYHLWSHRSPRSNGKIITFIQRIGLLQSPRYHARHHGGQKNTLYCTGTVYLNPILDKMRFWTALEQIIFWTIRVRRRPDASLVRGPDRIAPTCSAPSCQHQALAPGERVSSNRSPRPATPAALLAPLGAPQPRRASPSPSRADRPARSPRAAPTLTPVRRRTGATPPVLSPSRPGYRLHACPPTRTRTRRATFNARPSLIAPPNRPTDVVMASMINSSFGYARSCSSRMSLSVKVVD